MPSCEVSAWNPARDGVWRVTQLTLNILQLSSWITTRHLLTPKKGIEQVFFSALGFPLSPLAAAERGGDHLPCAPSTVSGTGRRGDLPAGTHLSTQVPRPPGPPAAKLPSPVSSSPFGTSFWKAQSLYSVTSVSICHFADSPDLLFLSFTHKLPWCIIFRYELFTVLSRKCALWLNLFLFPFLCGDTAIPLLCRPLASHWSSDGTGYVGQHFF